MSTKKDHDEAQLLASMARLHDTPDFNKFMEYIASLLVEYTQHCIDAENPAKVQGAAQVLQRIQNDVEDAEQAFYRLSNQVEIPID